MQHSIQPPSDPSSGASPLEPEPPSPPTQPNWKQWYQQNPWAPVVLRSLSAITVLLTLSIIGAVASAAEFEPAVPSTSVGAAIVGRTWIPPIEASTAPRATETPPKEEAPSVPAADPVAPAADPVAPAPDPSTETPSHPAAPPTTSPGVTSDGRVILNTATAADFERLPRVGPSRAAAILALRSRLGRFRRKADLLGVRGIGPATFAQIEPLVVLDPPAESGNSEITVHESATESQPRKVQ